MSATPAPPPSVADAAPIPPALSLALDALRAAACATVLLSHMLGRPFSTRVHWRFGAWGDTAVMVFFVLSGFVIAHVMATRERDGRSYAAARIARLQSVVLVALPLTALADALGMWIDPALYALPKVLAAPPSPGSYAASLLLVHEYHPLGLGAMEPGTNRPFWSLSFEATYYACAGLVVFGPRILGMVAAAVLLLAAGTTIMALLPVWTAGLLVYHAPPSPRRLRAPMLLAAAAVLLALPDLTRGLPAHTLLLRMPWGVDAHERRLTVDLIAGAASAVGLWALRDALSAPGRWLPGPMVQRAIRLAGRISFPLYAIHYPMLALATAASPFRADQPAQLAWLLAAVLLATVAVTLVSEPLHRALRRTILRIAPPRIA